MLREPGDPTPYEREQYERLYQLFCRRFWLDPEDPQSAPQFEEWFEKFNDQMEGWR